MPPAHIAEARVTTKGQITLPKKVKDILGASEVDYVLFFTEGHRIYIEAGRLTSKSRK